MDFPAPAPAPLRHCPQARSQAQPGGPTVLLVELWAAGEAGKGPRSDPTRTPTAGHWHCCPPGGGACWRLPRDPTPPQGHGLMVKVGAGGAPRAPIVCVTPGDYLGHHHFFPSLCRWEPRALEREGGPTGSHGKLAQGRGTRQGSPRRHPSALPLTPVVPAANTC